MYESAESPCSSLHLMMKRTSSSSSNKNYVLCFVGVWVLALIWMMRSMICGNASGSEFSGSNLRRRSSMIKTPQTTFEKEKLTECDHLIVVCGHAITIAESLDAVESTDSAWSLLPYQRNQDLPPTFVSHIRRGVEAAEADPKSLLVFSGGQTRPTAGPRSEGLSYWLVAEHFGWWENEHGVRDRSVIEDYARDSFENLMFSICRFNEVVGHYPTKFTVVGYTFKAYRFEVLHRPALGIDKENFEYIGIQPDLSSKFDLLKAEKGELENAVKLFSEDTYGCLDPSLKSKRAERNPYSRTVPYRLSCPELEALLDWCGPGVFLGELPWDIDDRP